MKNKKSFICIILLVSFLFLNSCKKDATEITSMSTNQKALVMDFTATWCHVCGENGTPAFDKAIAENEGNITAIAIHGNNSFEQSEIPEAKLMETTFSVTGYPSLMVGTKSTSYFDISEDVKYSLKVAKNAKIGIGLSKSINGTNMIIKATIMVFSEISGDYNLSIYITENGISHLQTRDTSPTQFVKIHNNVLRGSTTGAFGEKIIIGGAIKGQKIEKTYTFEIPTTVFNKDNLHLVGVIYLIKNGKPSSVLNSNSF